jgi:hypothetical protein
MSKTSRDAHFFLSASCVVGPTALNNTGNNRDTGGGGGLEIGSNRLREKLHDGELRNFHSSLDIIMVI